MILCTDYLTCNSFGDQDRCGYTEKEKQRKRLKVSGGARKLLCFIHLAVHGITGDIIIECGQGPHRGPVLRSFTGCWKQRSFFSFSFLVQGCEHIARWQHWCIQCTHFIFQKKLCVCVCVCWQLFRRKYSHSFSLPSALLPVFWNEGGEDWMGFGVFLLRKGHFVQPGQCSKD